MKIRVDQVSVGSLKKPSKEFLAKIKQLEAIFQKNNGTKISDRRNLQKHLVEKSKAVYIPERIKSFTLNTGFTSV